MIDQDELDAADVVYHSDRTLVRRLRLPDGRPVVVKEPLGRHAARRLRHERAVLARLAGVPGVVRLLDVEGPSGALVLEDPQAQSLAARLTGGPLPATEATAVAATLAQALAEVHRRGVVHRDVTPANVLLGDDGAVHLIDFDLSATAGTERPAFRHHSEIVGTLAYLAPEQTGRTGRPIDHRADLYGLGSTLYEALTGTPPFGDENPMQLVHDHLARIPVPPAQRNPQVPQSLSQIVARLLAKEPDERYQSADGLAHDLAAAGEETRDGRDGSFALGERDFPARLAPPSRLVGREPELAELTAAFDEVVAGGHGTVLVSGAPGVGKSALLNELRPLVTRAGGLFTQGGFDQFGNDQGRDGVQQALAGVVRLLLAEPEDVVLALRGRLLERLGTNAGLAAAVLPELGALLQLAPEPAEGDPSLVAARVQQIALDVLQVVAAPRRPVVLVVDDVQWATGTPLGLLDTLQVAERLAGVLVLASYRAQDVDAAHPLTALLARWDRLGVRPRRIHLENLPAPAVQELLREMLRLEPGQGDDLAAAVADRTGGNPFDTIVLVNGLRDDGLLRLGARGWEWDADGIRRYLGRGDVTELLARRLRSLPEPTRELLDVLSCLGAEVTLEVLAAASGQPEETVEDLLAPAGEAGLVVRDQGAGDQGGGVVQFRHDRVQEAVVARLDRQARTLRQRDVARRLAAVPELELLAAEPYLRALAELDTPAERRRVAGLLRDAAARSRVVANHPQTERYTAAALELLAPGGEPAPDVAASEVAAVVAEWHAALFALGRLEEADAAFARLRELTPDPLLRAGATRAQISSLTARDRYGPAVELALTQLADLDVPVPSGPEGFGAAIGPGLEALYDWANGTTQADDESRPAVGDPRLLALARTIDHAIPPAFFGGEQLVMTWMILLAGKLWADHGPAPALVGPLAHASFITTALGDDYATGNAIVRRVLAISEGRGWEPDTSRARFTYALSSSAWFEPVEETVRHAQRSHDGLVHGGDLNFAATTGYATLPPLLDRAAGLDELETEAQAAVAFCRRNGNDQAEAAFLPYRQLARALRGDTVDLGSFTDGEFGEDAYLAGLAANPVAAVNFRVTRAVSAALSGAADDLVHHAGALPPLMPFIHATYLMTSAHLVQALALAHRLRTEPDGGDRAAWTEQLAAHRAWLAGRAADAPGNFRHLLDLVEAETAWAAGDLRAAMAAFDRAHGGVPARRPWHHALILERAGRCYLDQGIDQVGRLLLGQARDAYEGWGAWARAAALERAYPALRRAPRHGSIGSVGGSTGVPAGDLTRAGIDTRRSQTLAGSDLDLVGILRATQALASETDLDRLRDSVTTILSALSGASAVHLALWSDDAQDWFVPVATAAGRADLTLDEAAAQSVLPLSAFRYTERTRQPLTVDDAARDDRFARDPYFADVDTCSLLVVPVLTRGLCKAMLILENRVSRAAFSPDRLDGVLLIAGQLAVSLDSAMLSSSLERRVSQRVKDLDAVNQRLVQLSNTDALTGLANRRHLAETLREAWDAGLAAGTPLAVIMIDIDHFKQYNDRYGHQAGDQCLRTVAAAVKECFRESDLVARYGGEEFTVVLPASDAALAGRTAQRARDAVAALAVPHDGSPHGVVTVSVGVSAVVPEPGGHPDRLLEAADRLLYEAKHNGRNRVVVG